MSEQINISKKIRSVILCLSAHPDNEPNSEFEDRITDLEEVVSFCLPKVFDQNKRLIDMLTKICIARRNGQEIPLLEIENLVKSATKI